MRLRKGSLSFYNLSQPEGSDNNAILSLQVAESGAVGVGTNSCGLDRFDPVTGKAAHFLSVSVRATSQHELIVLALCGSRTSDLWPAK
jgi:hypothetical protein